MALENEKKGIETTEAAREGSELYEMKSGINVELKYKHFEPTKGAPPEKEKHKFDGTVIFLPGWKMSEDAKSIDGLCKAYAADATGGAYSLTTRSEERGKSDIQNQSEKPKDFMHEEARAIGRFMHLNNIKQAIVAGHSQGGDKGAHLIGILQQDPTVKIEGLILLDSVGLYEQSAGELTRSFIADAALTTPRQLFQKVADSVEPMREGVLAGRDVSARGDENRETIKAAAGAGNEVTKEVAKEVLRSGLSSWGRFTSEVEEMGHKNAYLQEIKVPIIIETGSQDAVSDIERIVPHEEQVRIAEELGGVTPERAAREGIHEDDETLDAREKYLKDKLFPQSPYVRMLVPDKLGVHGLPLLRPESVANTSMYMLERNRRNQKEHADAV